MIRSFARKAFRFPASQQRAPRTATMTTNSAAATVTASTSSLSATTAQFPVAEAIRTKLQETFQPVHLEVINESHMHNVPKNSETHFKVVVVSTKFDKIRMPLQRHRLVNGTLQAELDGPVHALSIVAKSPAQWDASSGVIPPSPNCQGGDGSLPSKKSVMEE